ncbi:PA2B Phospholipase, partial [Eurystomus gularis]|nr:PA2B Phospholipase [Eurystomus gularis]
VPQHTAGSPPAKPQFPLSPYNLQKSHFPVTLGVVTARGKHPRAFAPGLEGSTVGNLTAHGCYSGWGSSGTSSHHRCCLQRACCFARLAARRCRLGPIQPLSASRAGIPTCRSGTWCQRGACRCERAAQLCRMRGRGMRGRGLLRRRSKCRGQAGRC